MFLGAVVFVIATAVVESIVLAATGTTSPSVRVGDWVLNVVAQWAFYVLGCGLLWLGISPWLDARERRPFRRTMLILLALMLLSIAATRLFTGLPSQQPEPAADESTGDSWLLALTPWLIIFGYLWFIAFRYMRGAVRRAWEAQNLQRPQTIELTVHGIRFDDTVCVRDYRWAGFTKWRENDAVFMLYISDVSFHIIPKRAMQPQDVEGFRRLLFQFVRPVDYAPLGFPMPALPIATPPPLPVAVEGGR